jgi:divalent metal cation (Fe/Co/Zn/Cd) transporter
VSDKPADDDHTYGHGKIENLSAFLEAGLMAVSCAWIIWEAMERIFRHTWCCITRSGRCWCC